MAQPPGRATRAVPWRATRGPRTRTEARMVETSSYGARSLDTCATCTPSPPVWRDTVAPRVSRSLVMVRTSARSGAFASVRGSAVRRQAGFVSANLRLEAGEDGARQVRRIAHEQVGAPSAQRVGEVAHDDRDALRETELSRVLSRDGRRGPRHVDRDHVDVASLRGERTRDRTRARAQVQSAQSDTVARWRQEPEGPLDQRLGLGPRDEDVRRQADPQPAERLPADDLLQRLTARAPPDRRLVARGDRRG